MKYREIRRRVLEHLDCYTRNGVEVPPAYNGQRDLMGRIPGLVNDAVTAIRGGVRPLWKRFTPVLGERTEEGLYRCALPEDFRAIRTVEGENWRMEDGKTLLLEKSCPVTYFCHPLLLPLDPGEEEEYGEEPDVLAAACCYAAAMLALAEDEGAYAALMRRYESLARPAPVGAKRRVEDVYGFFGGGL